MLRDIARIRIFLIGGLLLSCVLAGCATEGLTSQEQPRSPGSALVREMVFPPLQLTIPRVGREVQRRLLPNGIVLYLASDPSLPVLNAYAVFRAGSLYEAPASPGVARFTASQLRAGGTVTLSPEALNEELEVMGVSIESSVSSETISVTLNALAKDADRALQLFADAIRRPAFDPAPLETYRGQVVEDLRRLADSPSRLMTQEFARIMYTENYPLGRPLTPMQARAVQRESLLAFHRQFVRPDNMYVAIVGDFSVEELEAKIRARFGDWNPAGPRDLPPLPKVDPKSERAVYALARDLVQSSVILGHFGIDRTNPDRFAIQIMDYILGGGGFTSRIMERVRTEEGLAYSVASVFPTSTRDIGLFRVTVQTKNENVPRVVGVILEEMRRLQEYPATAEELRGAKDAFINSFVFRFSSRFRTVTQLLVLELDGYPPDYYETLLDRYRAVTVEDIQRVAGRYLRPDATTILTVGDVEKFESAMEAFGPLHRLPAPTTE
ncbi:MAG: pitrilysin family protein, partial [candidate division NC10 bacterium]|nr:pitrilysin family protein [candidate division NC10 bacterium]